MTVEQWGIVIGVLMAGLLALGPWMFMVHAKLAVLATKMTSTEDKVDKLIEANQQRLPMCARHEARLDTHNVKISQICERLRQTA